MLVGTTSLLWRYVVWTLHELFALTFHPSFYWKRALWRLACGPYIAASLALSYHNNP